MQPQMSTLSIRQRKILAIYFASFWIIGFALAFWEGLGWLMLFQAIQSLVFTFPRFYLSTLRLVLGKEAEEKEKLRLVERGDNRSISWRLAVRTVIAIGLTLLFFWKVNIPIIDFIKIVF